MRASAASGNSGLADRAGGLKGASNVGLGPDCALDPGDRAVGALGDDVVIAIRRTDRGRMLAFAFRRPIGGQPGHLQIQRLVDGAADIDTEKWLRQEGDGAVRKRLTLQTPV